MFTQRPAMPPDDVVLIVAGGSGVPRRFAASRNARAIDKMAKWPYAGMADDVSRLQFKNGALPVQVD
jgi:hypothetical protein